MKPLEIEFEKPNKGKFTQIYASKAGFCYLRRFVGRKYFEVFRRKENSQWNCISYPGNESFGYWAWCYVDVEKAKDKIHEIEYDHYHKQLP